MKKLSAGTGARRKPRPLLLQGGRGSNAWAISPNKTDSGRPLLCNDTHLALTCPGVWYLNHLNSEDGFHCIGSSIPGLPGLLLGHNENIAWGITLAFTDVEDVFVEKVDVANPGQYEYKGESREFEIIEETISVKGEEDHLEKLQYTVHGPLIGSVTDQSSQAIALCSKSLQPNTILGGFFPQSQVYFVFFFTEDFLHLGRLVSPITGVF